MPRASHDREAGASCQVEVVGQRPIARVFQRTRGANQPSPQQEVHARLQVRQVRHGHEQFAAGLQDAVQLGERAWLFLECQVLQHVETQRLR